MGRKIEKNEDESFSIQTPDRKILTADTNAGASNIYVTDAEKGVQAWQLKPAKKQIMNLLEANRIIPILATVPPVASLSEEIREEHRQMSEWVMESGYMYLDFEYFMSSEHDRVTPDPDMTMNDGMHPTSACHKQVAEDFLKKYGNVLK